MASNLINKYIWIVDTIGRYGSISRQLLSDLWQESEFGNGSPMPRRTFYGYRTAIAETLGIYIEFNKSTYEYYIGLKGEDNKRLQWLLDSMSISGMLSDAADLSGRIVLENVPSARDFLPTVIEAMRQNHRLQFSYKSYNRVNYRNGVVINPYFVKIFRQVWYVIGYNVADKKIKTYALDRMKDLVVQDTEFKMPPRFDAADFFADCYGITTSEAPAKRVILKVEPTQAKYFRALPLHPSQQEVIHDNYSVFSYTLRNTFDLRERLLSHGSAVEVLEPKELRTQIVSELKKALETYGTKK